jgi:hypothetical protein
MFVYDTGALAAERRDRRMLRIHARALKAGLIPKVPAPVLAQAWRGGPQPHLSSLLRGCEISVMDDDLARTVGAVLAKTRTTDVVDATAVAIAAQRPGGRVVTSDPNDLRAIAVASGNRVDVVTV